MQGLLSTPQQQQLVTNQGSPVHATEGWGWEDCGSPTDSIQIDSITVSPDPPKPGQDLTVRVKASAQERVEVKLGLIKILQKQFDLCDEARNANTTVQCPIEKGNYEVEQTVALPKEIPQAKFNVNVQAYTIDDDDLFCVKLVVNFMKKPFFKLPPGWSQLWFRQAVFSNELFDELAESTCHLRVPGGQGHGDAQPYLGPQLITAPHPFVLQRTGNLARRLSLSFYPDPASAVVMSSNYDVAFRGLPPWKPGVPNPHGRDNGVMLILRPQDRVAFMQSANLSYYYCVRHHGIEAGFSAKILVDTPANMSDIMPQTLPVNYQTITPLIPSAGVTDLTRNAFQSGIPPAKAICARCFCGAGKAPHALALTGSEAEISNAVLQAYLKEAIQNRLVSLPTFTSTFLLAARSRALREPGTLNLLCKTIQEAHLWSDPSVAPATLFPEDPDLALGTVRDALELLRATYDPMLPAHHFQRVVGPVVNLVLSLTNPTPNFVSASGALALECIQSIKDILLHTFVLDQNLRQPLENLALSLSLFLGENPGLTSRGSAYRARSSLGQVDILGPGLENHITTCSLLFFQLIIDRAKSYGSGHETHSTALLVAAFRTTAWPLQRFLTQLFQSAVACLSTDLSHMTSKRPLSLWNAFIAGRRAALHEAWGTLCFEDPLSSSLAHYENMWSLVGATPSLESVDKTVSFSSAFTYQLFSSGLLDQTFVVRVDPGLTSESPSRLQAEAREAGADFGRFDTASSSFDVETLGHISRVLAANETALDLVSLHVELSALVSGALVVVEEYDFEVVGDPQSAVGNLGDIVLFVQLATARFKIPDTLKHKNRPLDMSYLRKTDAILNSPVLTADEARALRTWFKALFDKNSEGIEDGVLRFYVMSSLSLVQRGRKHLLAVAATVFLTAVRGAAERKLEQDVLGNGNILLPGTPPCLDSSWNRARPRRGVSHPFDLTALRIEVTKAMGITVAGLASPSHCTTCTDPKSVEPMLDSSSLHCTDQPRRAIQNTLALIQSGKAPSLNVAACLVETSATDFLQTLWLELNRSIKAGMTIDAVKPLAVFILATPRGTLSPPLLPVFLHNVVPSLIDRSDNPMTGDLELLIAIVSSSLMAALQLERTLYTTSGQQIYPLGSSSSSMARRLAVDLRYRKSNPKGGLVAQRLTSSQTFVTSFPVFKTEI
ncbi:hypothetical protein EDB83DRAFT_2310327 [Lactarius deliciosus]|nr:hypothetical protein EDB83DRAFT_2310327 [Lactarius deliciosus]